LVLLQERYFAFLYLAVNQSPSNIHYEFGSVYTVSGLYFLSMKTELWYWGRQSDRVRGTENSPRRP